MRLLISLLLAAGIVGGTLYLLDQDLRPAAVVTRTQPLPTPVQEKHDSEIPLSMRMAPPVPIQEERCSPCTGPTFISYQEFSSWRDPDGQFYVNGSVNGVSVRFMVDSGAANTTLPAWVADRIGVRYGRGYRTATANGYSDGVIATGLRLALEGADLGPQDVVFLPNLSGSSLLGQNVLRQFDIRIEGDRIFFKKLRP